MKKLFLPVIVLLLFAACKKDTSNISNTTASKPLFGSTFTTDVAQPTYTDMVLAPRKPGENFDTYFAQWNSCGIEVKGPLAWNTLKYPTLQNGVPVVMSTISTYDGTSSLDGFNTGTDGNVFEVTQIFFGGLPSTGFQSDYDGYVQALDNWYANGSVGTEPTLSNALKTTYTAGGKVQTFTGKLIRVTTCSNLAIAPVTYPLPSPVAYPVPNLGNPIVVDSAINVHSNYLLFGTNGNITYAFHGTDGIFDGSTKIAASGSYTTTIGTGVFTFIGTIIRADGTIFQFKGTQDTN